MLGDVCHQPSGRNIRRRAWCMKSQHLLSCRLVSCAQPELDGGKPPQMHLEKSSMANLDMSLVGPTLRNCKINLSHSIPDLCPFLGALGGSQVHLDPVTNGPGPFCDARRIDLWPFTTKSRTEPVGQTPVKQRIVLRPGAGREKKGLGKSASARTMSRAPCVSQDLQLRPQKTWHCRDRRISHVACSGRNHTDVCRQGLLLARTNDHGPELPLPIQAD